MKATVTRLLFRERRCVACAAPFLPPPVEPVRMPGASALDVLYRGAASFLSPQITPADYFCPDCRSALPMPVRGYCPRCGEFAAWPTLPLAPCGACTKKPPPWDACFFAGPYQGLLRLLLRRFKFSGQVVYARALASLLAERLFLGMPAFDLLVPVPLHRKRLQARGYNQAQELARGLHFILGQRRGVGHLPADNTGAVIAPGLVNTGGAHGHRVVPRMAPEAMVRTVASHPQFGLSRTERVHNTQGIFAARPEVAGQRILLVDDIYTTGATMASACLALREAGAVSVSIAVIGRTPRRGHRT